MIGWEKELLTKTGLIMKKEATKGSMSGRKQQYGLKYDSATACGLPLYLCSYKLVAFATILLELAL